MIRECKKITYGGSTEYADCLCEQAQDYMAQGDNKKAKQILLKAAEEYDSCEPAHVAKATAARNRANELRV